MRHRNADGVITGRDGLRHKAVTLRAEDDRKARLRQQLRIADRQRVLPERHRRRFEAERPQKLRPRPRRLGQPRPRHLKDRPHAHADGAPVKRVARGVRQKHRVHAERRRRTEDRADICGIHHILKDGKAARSGADLLHGHGRRPAHRAEKAPRQRKAGQPLQHVQLRRIRRDLAAARKERLSLLARCKPRLHQKRERTAAGVQRSADDGRAFRDEDALLRVLAAEELIFAQTRVDIQLRRVKICDRYDSCHILSLTCIVPALPQAFPPPAFAFFRHSRPKS